MNQEPKRTLSRSRVGPALDFMSTIEEVRPGLGLPGLLLMAARLGSRWSNLGRGIFVVAPKGYGKGDLLESGSIPQLGYILEAGEELHPTYVKKALRDAISQGKPIERLAVLFEDLGDLHGDKKKIRRTIGLGSRQISQLSSSFTGFLDSPNGGPSRFKSVSWACGMTPDVFDEIRAMGTWGAKWSDRFSRLAIVRTANDAKRMMHYKRKKRQVSKLELREILMEKIGEVPENVTIDVDDEELETSSKEIWGSWVDDPRTIRGARVGDVQHTESRRLDYLRNDLRGMAAINGRDYAIVDDLRLLEMGAPLYRIGSLDPWDAWITILAMRGMEIADVEEETNLDAFKILEHIRAIQRYGLVFPTIRNPEQPWNGTIKQGWYFEDWLEDLEALKTAG